MKVFLELYSWPLIGHFDICSSSCDFFSNLSLISISESQFPFSSRLKVWSFVIQRTRIGCVVCLFPQSFSKIDLLEISFLILRRFGFSTVVHLLVVVSVQFPVLQIVFPLIFQINSVLFTTFFCDRVCSTLMNCVRFCSPSQEIFDYDIQCFPIEQVKAWSQFFSFCLFHIGINRTIYLHGEWFGQIGLRYYTLQFYADFAKMYS